MAGAHKNSLYAQAQFRGDKETIRKIKEGRRQADLDQDTFEVWARNDFQAGTIRDDEPTGQ